MKVSELIEALKLMPQDLIVYGYCDHGQTPERAAKPQVVYTEELDSTLFDGYSMVEQDEFNKQFVIL